MPAPRTHDLDAAPARDRPSGVIAAGAEGRAATASAAFALPRRRSDHLASRSANAPLQDRVELGGMTALRRGVPFAIPSRRSTEERARPSGRAEIRVGLVPVSIAWRAAADATNVSSTFSRLVIAATTVAAPDGRRLRTHGRRVESASPSVVRKTRALTTCGKLRPAASSSSRAFSMTARVCVATSPLTTVLSLPFLAIRPDRNSVLPARMPYEYGFGDTIHDDGWTTRRSVPEGTATADISTSAVGASRSVTTVVRVGGFPFHACLYRRSSPGSRTRGAGRR